MLPLLSLYQAGELFAESVGVNSTKKEVIITPHYPGGELHYYQVYQVYESLHAMA